MVIVLPLPTLLVVLRLRCGLALHSVLIIANGIASEVIVAHSLWKRGVGYGENLLVQNVRRWKVIDTER